MSHYEYPEEVNKDWYDKVWLELDEDKRNKIIAHLLNKLPSGFLDEVEKEMKSDPEDWSVKPRFIEGGNIPYNFHTTTGMSVRNLLRDLYTDDEVPTGNWGDVYIQALEATILADKQLT